MYSKVPIEDTLNGVVAMSNMQKKADAMMKDIKIKEVYLLKVSQEVESAKMRMKNTQKGSNKLRMDMMNLQKELRDLQLKDMMIEKTNQKLELVQER